jgi:hypothetical protein
MDGGELARRDFAGRFAGHDAHGGHVGPLRVGVNPVESLDPFSRGRH